MKHFYTFLVAILFTSLGFGQVFITELADPNDNANARYIELYNAGASTVDLSNWRIDKYTNASASVSQSLTLTGTIDAGGFYIIATGPADSVVFDTWGVTPDQWDPSGDNVAGSNGDDNLELYDASNTLIDQFGVPGEDGTGTCHEFEDGRAERIATITSGNPTWNEAEWNVWADSSISGCTNHTGSAQDTTDSFDPGAWIGASAPSTDTLVQFDSASASVSEGIGTMDLTFSITNPDGTNATSFDVELTTGDNADINGYTTQTVTFPAGSSTDETVTITITDDTIFEGNETLTFTISGVTGGNNATIGSQATFDLTIEENDPSPSIPITIENFDGSYPKWNNDIESQLFVDPSTPDEGLFIQAASSSNPNFSGNTVFGRDLEGETSEPSLSPYTFTFDNVDVSDYTSIVVSFDYHAFANAETGNYEVVIDGVGQGSVQYFNDPDSSPGVNGTISVPVADGTSTVGLILTGTLNGGSDVIEFDNFKIEGVYNGYAYSDGSWYPANPDGTTGASNAIVADGVATFSSDVSLNDVVVNPGAGLEVETGNTLTVNSLTLESSSTSYSSLILDGSISGTVTYNRSVNSFTNDATNNDNDLISAPVTGQTFGSFDSANANLLASGSTRAFAPFNNITGVYENYDATTNAATTLDAAAGYRAATTNGGTLSFTGNAEGGNISKNVTIGDDITYGIWNLVGNPYPSYLDVETFLTHVVSTQTSGERNIDLMESASGVYGFDGDASDGWKIITLANASGELIAPGQGFFVAADGDDVLAHDIEFTPAMRTSGNADDFIANRTSNPLTFVKLRASTAYHSYNTEFYFNDNASLGLDPGYDAVIWGGVAPSTFALYSHLIQDNTGMPIALQALGSGDISDVTIPLGLNANASETLTISISEMNIPASVNVYLEDYENNTYTLLNNTNFVTTPSSNLIGTGRFYLRFSNSALSTTNAIFEGVSIYTNQSNKTINIAGQLTEGTFANVYDIQGRLVSSKKLVSNATSQTIDVSNLTTGIYIVKLTNGNSVKTEKVILK